MIVGFDATTVRGNKTGVGYYTSRLLERLTRVDGERNPIDQLLVLSNRPIEVPPVPRSRIVTEGRFPLRAVWMQAVLPALLAKIRPDLCHFTNFLGPRFSDVPYVVTFHDMTLELLPGCHTWKKRALTRSLTPEIARRARFLITPSESARRDVARLFGIPAEKIRAIPHAPDDSFRPRRDRESLVKLEKRYGVRRPYLLYVGTLEPRKNLARAVTAFSRVAPRFPEHRFYLAGDLGWQSKDLLRVLGTLPHRERIERLGYVAEEDLPALYSNAELFVYPSLYEGFGFPVVEAMACGVPVLTSDTSSLAEIAAGAAFLVDPLDLDAMTEAMERGLEDAPARERVVRAGMARALSFSWERSTRETLSVYEEALERPTSGARWPRPSIPVDGRKAQAIVDTIAYGALFEYPMTLPEIHRSLMGVPLSRRDVSRLLARHPLIRDRVETVPPYHFLKGRRATIESRLLANRRTRELLARELPVIDLVRRTPFVRMVAFSGATAHGNARDGDVDLFVVTTPGRTWSVAFLLHALTKVLGRRRTICLNYFLAEDRLALDERDVFTASQIVALKPIAGRGTFYRLVRANAWGAEFFPNFWDRFRSLVPSLANEPAIGCLVAEVVLAPVAPIFERIARLLLGAYLRRRLARVSGTTSVKLETGIIKLHFKDHGASLAREIETIRGSSPVDDAPEGQSHVGSL
jgi:glycosyltransferase involved in cell wall biosynthesis